MFREDEHPRDKSGKFTDKGAGAGAGEAEKLRKAVRIYSDEPDKDAPPQKVPEPATGFNRLETKHHQRHAKEMGFKNTKEYEKAAVEFFNSDKGKLYYSEKWGKFYRYDEKAQLLAISSKGVIHTFWKRTQKEFERIRRQDQLNGI